MLTFLGKVEKVTDLCSEPFFTQRVRLNWEFFDERIVRHSVKYSGNIECLFAPG